MKIIFLGGLTLFITGCFSSDSLPEKQTTPVPTSALEKDFQLEITEDPLKQIDLINQQVETLSELE